MVSALIKEPEGACWALSHMESCRRHHLWWAATCTKSLVLWPWLSSFQIVSNQFLMLRNDLIWNILVQTKTVTPHSSLSWEHLLSPDPTHHLIANVTAFFFSWDTKGQLGEPLPEQGLGKTSWVTFSQTHLKSCTSYVFSAPWLLPSLPSLCLSEGSLKARSLNSPVQCKGHLVKTQQDMINIFRMRE